MNENNSAKGYRIFDKRILLGLVLVLLVLVACPLGSTAATAQSVDLGIPVLDRPELFFPRSMPVSGEGRVAVFLIDFPDLKNENPYATKEFYQKLYFEGGIDTASSYWRGKSVASFYKEQSYGKLELEGEVFDWYTARHERSYYDERKAELVLEAAEYYASQGADFSRFDGDNDGVIDAIVFHFTGVATNDRSDPWYPGLEYSSETGFGRIDGLELRTFAQVLDRAGSNTGKNEELLSATCHELFHALGMPDLYSEKVPLLAPTEDLMGLNEPFINPYLKMLLGWFDSVKLITEDTSKVSLALYGGAFPGEVAIVSDGFDGLFDEFYMVAYRDFHGRQTAVVWHVDARLNETGDGFLYQNLYYKPRADKKGPHDDGGYCSAHPFIEELSGDPKFDFILNKAIAPEQTGFTETSAVGANCSPSADGHDGNYMGFRIDNFVRRGQSLTFDVSFVKDTLAPTVSTGEEDLELKESVKLRFNEFVYEGSAFGSLEVTDLEGRPLEMSYLLPDYPHNELEITFKNGDYKDGYIVQMPLGFVKDSSGNPLAETVLTATATKYLFPESTRQLPETGEFIRNNEPAYFFREGENTVVITPLWETAVNYPGESIPDARIEFMRLDPYGNVLTQTVTQNPFVDPAREPLQGGTVANVARMGDGSYAVFCIDSGYADMVFCIDSDGKIRWKNDSWRGSGRSFTDATAPMGSGLVVGVMREVPVFIDSEDGSLTTQEESFLGTRMFDLGEGGLLRCSFEPLALSQSGAEGFGLRLDLLDRETHEPKRSGCFADPSKDRLFVDFAHLNADGTLVLYYTVGFDQLTPKTVILDTEFNLVRSVGMTDQNAATSFDINWIGDEGFCEIFRTVAGNHSNEQFHVTRYDRYLNVIWETDVEANFVYFFKNPDGEIVSYRSAYEPTRECFIDNYGSEDGMMSVHTHKLAFIEGVKATASEEGRRGHWYCADCGVYFSDRGNTVISDLKSLSIPPISAHAVAVYGGLTDALRKTVDALLLCTRMVGTALMER